MAFESNYAALSEFRDPMTGEVRPDNQLENVVRSVLRREYVLVPQGTETQSQLENRIISGFVEKYGWNWNGRVPEFQGIGRSPVIGDINFFEYVSHVSPLSKRRVTVADVLPQPIPVSTGQTVIAQPKPGLQKAPLLTGDQILKMVDSTFGFLGNVQRNQLAAKIAQQQQQGLPVFVPTNVASDLGLGWKIGIGLGALAVAIGIGYVLYSRR